ncbi:hypothetical protein PHJA_002470500 [Phtheirospermum japonicum]|uniref:Uncharacterized protein n=1 Tax=Phtheirospermum japonicum TaxID=374723 RepID=A0A830CVP3_9LAMI|nr:hypothetical protein PHJA_002470500 [Phtheirospermum japonicum]
MTETAEKTSEVNAGGAITDVQKKMKCVKRFGMPVHLSEEEDQPSRRSAPRSPPSTSHTRRHSHPMAAITLTTRGITPLPPNSFRTITSYKTLTRTLRSEAADKAYEVEEHVESVGLRLVELAALLKLVCVDIDRADTEKFAQSVASLAMERELQTNFKEFQTASNVVEENSKWIFDKLKGLFFTFVENLRECEERVEVIVVRSTKDVVLDFCSGSPFLSPVLRFWYFVLL